MISALCAFEVICCDFPVAVPGQPNYVSQILPSVGDKAEVPGEPGERGRRKTRVRNC